MSASHATPILRALEIARWAPSGDNSQPWRFTILDAYSVRIRIARQLGNPYEFRDGEPVLICLGGLLESLRIAASAEGFDLAWQYEGYEAPHHIASAQLVPASIATDPLLSHVATRSVNRKPMKTPPLGDVEKATLTAALDCAYQIIWHEGRQEKWRCTRLSMIAADLRLRMRSSYELLNRTLDWNRCNSTDKMPVLSLPVSPLTRTIMRWAMKSWTRIDFMNRYLGGTIAPVLETELIPGMRCAAHFSLVTPNGRTVPALIQQGIALQRLWLTATSIGITLQPMYSMLIFSHYGNHDDSFTEVPLIRTKAVALGAQAREFYASHHVDLDQVWFAGRIGYPYPTRTQYRSVRLPLEALIEG